MFLHEVQCAVTFENIRQVDEIFYTTYIAAYDKRGLLEDDSDISVHSTLGRVYRECIQN